MSDLHDCDDVDELARQWVEEAGPTQSEVPGAEGGEG